MRKSATERKCLFTRWSITDHLLTTTINLIITRWVWFHDDSTVESEIKFVPVKQREMIYQINWKYCLVLIIRATIAFNESIIVNCSLIIHFSSRMFITVLALYFPTYRDFAKLIEKLRRFWKWSTMEAKTPDAGIWCRNIALGWRIFFHGSRGFHEVKSKRRLAWWL